jgi:hypothetical protein
MLPSEEHPLLLTCKFWNYVGENSIMTWIAIDSGRESATHTLVQIPPVSFQDLQVCGKKFE